MDAFTHIVDSFENKELGELCANVSKAMRTGQSEAQVQAAIKAKDDFVVTNIKALSGLDIARSDDYGGEVLPYTPSQRRATRSDGTDFEAAILNAWDNRYGIHYS